MQGLRINASKARTPPSVWNELFLEDGAPRALYAPLIQRLSELPGGALRRLDEGLESTLREMGVTFSIEGSTGGSRKPWECDLLPQIFSFDDWSLLTEGVAQRLRAMECFLEDIYGNKQILRDGTLPVQAVLGSPWYQRAACGLPRPGNQFLFLSGMAVARTTNGKFAVRHHYCSNASGISYMMQNRRALSRVMSEFFEGYSIHSIADAPTDILEVFRRHSREVEPTVVLLSPGQGSAAYAEHTFLGRRMGIPVVQGSDLLVHGDCVFMKTITGLERVGVIYSRLADPWLDPLVFNPNSLLGVAGLLQCIRKGTVVLMNSIGSQLADDRALLPFCNKIIRYYLRETPKLATVPTFWLGDLDQREHVLSNLEDFAIRPLYGEKILTPPAGEPFPAARQARLRKEMEGKFSQFVAQPRNGESLTVCFENGRPEARLQDHIVFALRKGAGRWEIFPGALTRTSSRDSAFVASELGGGSKDTWVEAGRRAVSTEGSGGRHVENRPAPAYITSRVAESFYWVGRYLERASSLANMIRTIESLEAEELNPSEQKLYRPVWNRMLPPLENREEVSRRTISSPQGRYFLMLDSGESGSVKSSILRAAENADAIQEALSVEAASVLSELQEAFRKIRFSAKAGEKAMVQVSRRLAETVGAMVPQFFGVAEATMILDGGWRFCLLGQMVERGIITANALSTISRGLVVSASEQATEIRLSAFLRLLSSRDAYRRVYQMRIEPASVLELLWDNPSVPRAVRYCLDRASWFLMDSGADVTAAGRKTLHEIESLRAALRHTDWEQLISLAEETSQEKKPASKSDLEDHCDKLLANVLRLHTLITDGFLNHQIHLRQEPQPLLKGFSADGI